jgi:A/G-specific adenine glycosylase
MQIVLNILQWYQKNKRDLPWRATNNPYFIWLSEIILQQTQVIQGLNYYYKFIENFPTIHHLAAANEEDILKLWQGLGYYSRARNLHKAAQTIVNDFNGEFPSTYNDVLKLSGVGPYTASAITSMAYELPYPVLDGNVYRFVARLYNIDLPINQPKTYTAFQEILTEMMVNQKPSTFNNAMMEMGAIVCKPVQPLCQNCPVLSFCEAYKKGTVNQLPVKLNKVKVKTRVFNYFYFNLNGAFYMEKRTQKDIWENMYQLPLIETNNPVNNSELKLMLAEKQWGDSLDINFEMDLSHQLTHQKILVKVWSCSLDNKSFRTEKDWIKVDEVSYKKYPIPKLIEKIVLHLHG